MQGSAYIWVVWEGRMSTTYLALSGIREVFLKTCASHLNTCRIISKCQLRQLDIFSFCSWPQHFMALNRTALQVWWTQLFYCFNKSFHICHCVVSCSVCSSSSMKDFAEQQAVYWISYIISYHSKQTEMEGATTVHAPVTMATERPVQHWNI